MTFLGMVKQRKEKESYYHTQERRRRSLDTHCLFALTAPWVHIELLPLAEDVTIHPAFFVRRGADWNDKVEDKPEPV